MDWVIEWLAGTLISLVVGDSSEEAVGVNLGVVLLVLCEMRLEVGAEHDLLAQLAPELFALAANSI